MNDQSRALVQAITGPIILITVGSLFALDKSFGYSFRQTWPVLIIVIGLLRLFGGPRRNASYRNFAAAGQNPTPNAQAYSTPPVYPAPVYPTPAQQAAGPQTPGQPGYNPFGYDPSAPPPPPQPGVRQ